jgi:putative flippase GtrA
MELEGGDDSKKSHLALTAEAAKFLVCGGIAAFVNWAARIALAAAMSFEAAVIVAYLIGMSVGFALYRNVVWTDRGTSLSDQVVGFVLVNALSAAVVLVVAVGLRATLSAVAGPGALIDGAAHGTAIGVGAVANFIGHRSITFRRRADRVS